MSATKVRGFIKDLPKVLHGTKPDVRRLRVAYWSVFAYYLYKEIGKAYLIKSGGGSDEMGGKWKPLSKNTIASRPIVSFPHGKLSSVIGRRKEKTTRGLLTPSQDTLWKGIFASNMKRLAPIMGLSAAKAQAAKTAWAILKSKGANTKLAMLGGRKVPIMIRSGRLYKSLKEGKLSGTNYSPSSPDQIFGIERQGRVKLGTEVPYAEKQAEARPLWPKDLSVWISRATEKANEALAHKLQEIF
tara:strand:- start:1098 stop:1826 length:729 start_codon:yes stop_codon:yes gene_type:complete